jgi:hypothetical protein
MGVPDNIYFFLMVTYAFVVCIMPHVVALFSSHILLVVIAVALTIRLLHYLAFVLHPLTQRENNC